MRRRKEEYKIKHIEKNLKYLPTILTHDVVEVGDAKVQHEVVIGNNKPEGEKANIDQPKIKNAIAPNNSQFWVSNVDTATRPAPNDPQA